MIKIGIDIIDVERIRSAIERWGNRFSSKVYTKQEIENCGKAGNSYQRFAGKFAAKESVKKALMSINPTLRIAFNQIEILNESDGKPFVKLYGPAEKISKDYSIEVSISHEEKYATAISVVVT